MRTTEQRTSQIIGVRPVRRPGERSFNFNVRVRLATGLQLLAAFYVTSQVHYISGLSSSLLTEQDGCPSTEVGSEAQVMVAMPRNRLYWPNITKYCYSYFQYWADCLPGACSRYKSLYILWYNTISVRALKWKAVHSLLYTTYHSSILQLLYFSLRKSSSFSVLSHYKGSNAELFIQTIPRIWSPPYRHWTESRNNCPAVDRWHGYRFLPATKQQEECESGGSLLPGWTDMYQIFYAAVTAPTLCCSVELVATVSSILPRQVHIGCQTTLVTWITWASILKLAPLTS